MKPINNSNNNNNSTTAEKEVKGARKVAAEQTDECANCGTIWTAAQAKFKRCSRCKLVK